MTTNTKKGGKRIAIYLDGTWNTPEDRTNVFALYEETVGERAGPEILKPKKFIFGKEKKRRWLYEQYKKLKDFEHLRYYDTGVGTRRFNRVRGGTFGRGVSENISQAYEFLSHVWQPGDEIYVFGYSRGAYTARSLVGLLSLAGLIQAEDCLDKNKRQQAIDYLHDFIKYTHEESLKVFRSSTKENPPPEKPEWLNKLPKERQNIKVKFIGVWDTVASMGKPASIKSRLLNFFGKQIVHETLGNAEICTNVEHAYHAMAIDEHRLDFYPVLWIYPQKNTTALTQAKKIKVEQCWFVGAHSNVGGGYKDNYLHEIPCYWMQQKAIDAGLLFHHKLTPSNRALKEPIVDSYDAFMGGMHKKFTPRAFRSLKPHTPDQGGEVINEQIHESVWQYYEQNHNYRPQNIPSAEIAMNINMINRFDNIA